MQARSSSDTEGNNNYHDTGILIQNVTGFI